MRFPSFPQVIRNIYILTNATHRLFPAAQRTIYSATRPVLLRSSMPLPFIGSLFSSSSSSKNMSYPGDKPKEEWQTILSKEQFRVIREKGTEAPFSGKYDKHYPSEGVYACAACETPLYTAEQKFKSGCGWPAFYDAIPGALTRHTDSTFGMARTEIVCSNCGGHLGHVFKGEGYSTPTDERHCVNSVSIKFNPDDKIVDKKDGGEAAKV